MTCALAVLAAGSSSRLGQPKQLISFGGKTLLRYALETSLAAALPGSPVVVVLGANAEACLPETRDLPVHVLQNDDWSEGLASSVRMAVRWARDNQADALLFLLCDQPFVTVALLQKLLTEGQTPGKSIVACTYDDQTVGVPMLFTKLYFQELLALEGDKGAKAILQQHKERVGHVPFPEGRFDIDTPADVERLQTKNRLR